MEKAAATDTQRGRGVWLAAIGEFLRPPELARALDAGCGQVPTVAVVSACYSGVFAAPPMTAPNRIVLTAARADRPSFGCAADRTSTSTGGSRTAPRGCPTASRRC